MSIESTLFAALDNDATLTTLVASRIFPLVADQDAALPYITYQVIATEPHNVVNGSADTERKLIQVNCFAKKTTVKNGYTAAKEIAVACKAAINGTVGYLNGEGDDYFQQTQIYRVRLDFALIG